MQKLAPSSEKVAEKMKKIQYQNVKKSVWHYKSHLLPIGARKMFKFA